MQHTVLPKSQVLHEFFHKPKGIPDRNRVLAHECPCMQGITSRLITMPLPFFPKSYKFVSINCLRSSFSSPIPWQGHGLCRTRSICTIFFAVHGHNLHEDSNYPYQDWFLLNTLLDPILGFSNQDRLLSLTQRKAICQ